MPKIKQTCFVSRIVHNKCSNKYKIKSYCMLLIKISGSKLVSMICCSLCEASFRVLEIFRSNVLKDLQVIHNNLKKVVL